VALLCWLPPVLAVPVLVNRVRAAWRGRAVDPRAATGFCLALCCLFAANQVLRFDPLLRFLQCGPLVFPLWFAVGWAVVERLRGRAVVRRVLVALTIVLPLALACLVVVEKSSYRLPVEYTGSIAVRLERRVPFDVRGTEFQFKPRRANALGRLTRFVDGNTDPGDPILVLGEPSCLYFLTGRQSPLPLVRVADPVVERFGREVIERTVIESSCRFVIADRRFLRGRGRGWRRFLDEHCKIVGPVGKRFRVWEVV
jgi:hypothetical protein